MLIADKFIHSGKRYYEKRFPEILVYIISAYKQLLADKEPLENSELFITEILVETYLNKGGNREKLGIEDVIFNREPAENDGFVDIKVQTINSLSNPEAYYIFECKRLDGTARLNREYIREGILRFTSGKYSSYYGVNGMIGYEVKKLNTPVNVQKINSILLSDYPLLRQTSGMEPVEIIEDFKFSYQSVHCFDSSRRLRLFHLILDMSFLINTNQ
jgi:hypothetical protein